MKKILKIFIPFIVIALIIIGIYHTNALGLQSFISNKKAKMTYTSFLDAVKEGKVDRVTLDDDNNSFLAELNGKKDTLYEIPHPKTEAFTEFLLLNDISVSYGKDSFISGLVKVLIVAVIAVIIIYYTKNGGNTKLIKDANKKSQNLDNITLDQVAGNVEAKSMVSDIIGFIKNPDKYTCVGARMPKGLLFYGPPGTGKTLMAKAIAGEAGVPFYAMSGSDFVQMYVGVGASRIRNLFKKAKKSEKAVIFIDEIDAIGKKRARNSSASNDERDQTLNALLTEMSGFHDNQGIVIIGATNRLDILDEALLRPGRFDRQVEIGLPDVNSRHRILSLYAKSKPLSENVQLDELAKSTVYFSGADLENLLNEAAIQAANEKQKVINKDHIDKAFYTVIAGAPKIDRSYISKLDRKITAYHEAGHALATTLLLSENYISKVTIIPSIRGAGGFNLSIPKDTMYQSLRQIKSNIMMLLAGRAAEELVFGKEETTTGASNDIKKASIMIAEFIDKYGMDPDLGLFSTDALDQGRDDQLIKKCRTLMNHLYDDTLKLLQSNIDKLEEITLELLDKETLNGEDIRRICA